MYCSEEDTSTKNVIDSWINKFSNSNIVKDYEIQFYKGKNINLKIVL